MLHNTIIGLGETGIAIADAFKAINPEYHIMKIASNIENFKDNISLDTFINPEDYEQNFSIPEGFFNHTSHNIWFVVNGSELEANISLIVLEHLIKDLKKKVSIIYFEPEKEYFGLTESQQEYMINAVLQEKSRSGTFEMMYIISESKIEAILGGLPIIGRTKIISDTIAQVFHMIKSLEISKPVSNTFSMIPVGARIATFGIIDFEKNEDKDFFPLDFVSDIRYFYTYDEEVLNTKVNLLNEIKKDIKHRSEVKRTEKKNLEAKSRISFGIYANTFDKSLGYFIKYSSLVQYQ